MTTDRQAEIERRKRMRLRFTNSVGIPVSCFIFVECSPDGPRIIGSVEVERSSGNRIVSDSPLSDDEVLTMYLHWRHRPENQDRRFLIEAPEPVSPIPPVPVEEPERIPVGSFCGSLFSEKEIEELPF